MIKENQVIDEPIKEESPQEIQEENSHNAMKYIFVFTGVLLFVSLFLLSSMATFAVLAGLAATASVAILFIRMHGSTSALPRYAYQLLNDNPLVLDILLTVGGMVIFGASGSPVGYFIGAAFGLFTSVAINMMRSHLAPVKKPNTKKSVKNFFNKHLNLGATHVRTNDTGNNTGK